MIGSAFVPERVTIDGVTYRNGFYGDLFPLFGSKGDVGSITLQKEVAHNDGLRTFHRVAFEGHDWVHSQIGGTTGGTVYCEESEWERTRDFYADPTNFNYYYGIGYYTTEKSVPLSYVDPEKFDALLAFSIENDYSPFDQRSNKRIESATRKIPKSEFSESYSFYKVSVDGYFTTVKHMFFIHEGKLLLVFYHEGSSKQVVALDVPDELGQYFIDLLD